MTAAELNQVALQYRLDRDSLTEKDKAIRERALWAMASPETRKSETKRDFLQRLVGEVQYSTTARQAILVGGDASDVIWKRIDDKQMLLKTGSLLVIKAKKIAAATNVDMATAITGVLAEYDALPVVRTANGIPYRSGSTKGKASFDPTPFLQADQMKNRGFWVHFRTALSGFLEQNAVGIDASTKELLKKGFETDVKVLVDQFLSVVRREQSKGKERVALLTVAITRGNVLDACEALHMDPPQADGRVDLEKARRQKRLLARAYHPDSNGGDETMQGKYVVVIQAFQTLETYSEQFNAETHRAENL